MHIIRGCDPIPAPLRRSALAIGNFDGVHRGHQALLAAARQAAAPTGTAGVMLFDPHPRRFFSPGTPHFELTPLEAKLDLLGRYGMKLTVVQTFDAALANLTADDFISSILVDRLGVGHVVIGYDFHFGKGRSGSPDSLREAGRHHGFGVTVLPPVKAGTEVASSSAIRAALGRGSIGEAAAMLGHWWRIEGTVTGGARRGTGMGYPTANVTLASDNGLAHGIYAARVYVDGDVHGAASYLGRRPTFDNGVPVLETFLLDYDGDLYNKRISVEPVARLREDRAFPSMAALTAQMAEDVAATRRHLAALAVHDPLAWPPTQ